MKSTLDTGTSALSSSGDPQVQGIAPSEALKQFESPEGGVPVMFDAVPKQQRYGFRTVGLGLLVRQGVGSEVVPVMPMAVIPNSPAWLLGVINLRGNLVPVCDLRRLIDGNTETSPEKPMILVLDKGDKAAGFLIDGFPLALTELRSADQLPDIPLPLAQHVTAMITPDEELWLEFDHEALLEEASSGHKC
jgi:twitching motility protein PilI